MFIQLPSPPHLTSTTSVLSVQEVNVRLYHHIFYLEQKGMSCSKYFFVHNLNARIHCIQQSCVIHKVTTAILKFDWVALFKVLVVSSKKQEKLKLGHSSFSYNTPCTKFLPLTLHCNRSTSTISTGFVGQIDIKQIPSFEQ